MCGSLSVARRRASRAKRERRSGVRCEVRWQDLDSDVAPQLAVARAIHLAHATRAKRRHNRVGPELPPNHLRSIWRAHVRDRLQSRPPRVFPETAPRPTRSRAATRLPAAAPHPPRTPLSCIHSLPDRTRQRRVIELGDLIASINRHPSSGERHVRSHANTHGSRYGRAPGLLVRESSRINQFFSKLESLITVSGEIFQRFRRFLDAQSAEET